MNRERLELMVTLLKEVEAGTWEPTGTSRSGELLAPLLAREAGSRPGHRFELTDWVDTCLPDCGFAACAIGHACLDARFNAQGLRLNWKTVPIGIGHHPTYEGDDGLLHNWLAVEAFFGLTQYEADRLFDAEEYPGSKRSDPANVRQRIEKLLIKK